MREHVVRLPARGLAGAVCAARCDGAVEVSSTFAAGGLAAVCVHVCFGRCAVGTNAITKGALEPETATKMRWCAAHGKRLGDAV